MKIQIEVINETNRSIDSRTIKKLTTTIWRQEGQKDAHITIVLVPDSFIRNLNKKYLRKDRVTDVIAFPLTNDEEEPFEGEIYISLHRVQANAKRFQIEFLQELKRVAAHGVLHFLGYDDQTQEAKQAMTDREDFYLSY
ncbi:MAG: rRNA maturation RNase YbeY [bacterium]